MKLGGIDMRNKIFVSAEFLTAICRPGVIFIYAGHSKRAVRSVQRGDYHCAVALGSNGDILLDVKNETTVDWIELGIKPISKVYLVGGDHRLQALLAPLNAVQIGTSDTEVQKALAVGYEECLTRVSQKNLALSTEVYALRLALEEAQSAQFEAQEAYRKRGSLIPWIDNTLPPNKGYLPLGLKPHLIEQVLAVDPKGFSAFDLNVEHIAIDRDLDVVARLFYLDDGMQIAEWEANLRARWGWIHFRLPKALGDGATGLVLKLWISAASDHAATSRLMLSDVSVLFGGDVRLDNEVLPGRALAVRTWKGPQGLILSRVDGAPNSAKRRDPKSLSLNWNWSIADARPLEPLASKTLEMPGLFEQRSDFIQAHLLPGATSVVRVPNAIRTQIAAITADVLVAHPDGPFAQFCLGIARPNEPDASLELMDIDKLVASSGWVTAGKDIRSTVSVSLPIEMSGNFDLLLATRVADGFATEYGWAQFHNLRADWRPDHSFPVSFKPAADFEPLKLQRDRMYERRLRYSDTSMPLVSIACAVHRLDDLPNLVKQLVRQTYTNIDVLIALNGPHVTAEACDALKAVLPSAKVWIDPGTNLPMVLNNCVKAAKGELFFKIDADDIYGAEFVSDIVRETCITQAAIVGKSCFGVYFPEMNEITLHRSHPFHQYVKQVAGGTLCVRMGPLREILFDETYSSGSDYKLQVDFTAKGHRIWSSDPFNYLHVRFEDAGRHTWKGTPRDYKAWPHYRAYRESESWLFFV